MKAAKGSRGKADKLFSQFVRSRDPVCRARDLGFGACSTGPTQCAHLISRRYARTRTCEDNAVGLCAYHHWLVDETAHLKMALVCRTIGQDRYEELWELAQDTKGQRFDWDAELARLQYLATAREAAS